VADAMVVASTDLLTEAVDVVDALAVAVTVAAAMVVVSTDSLTEAVDVVDALAVAGTVAAAMAVARARHRVADLRG
jgi:hypothetical protein